MHIEANEIKDYKIILYREIYNFNLRILKFLSFEWSFSTTEITF
jgi:hypothetical protein